MPNCPVCRKPVYLYERVQSLGKDWHRACLRCCNVTCKKMLAPGSHSMKDGKPYCNRCYGALFSSTGPSHGSAMTDPSLGAQKLTFSDTERKEYSPAPVPSTKPSDPPSNPQTHSSTSIGAELRNEWLKEELVNSWLNRHLIKKELALVDLKYQVEMARARKYGLNPRHANRDYD